jgi:transposase
VLAQIKPLMDDFQLSDKQVAALKVLHKAQRDRRLAYRINAIILLGTGWSVADVAQALLVDESTVRLWCEKYQQEGQKGLTTLQYQGATSFLTKSQQKELAKHLEKNTYLTSIEIRHYIKKTYHVEYSPTGVKELLHRLGFVYKKPKHVPGKLDPNEQEAFLEEYRRLRETRDKNDPVYFADACHPQYNSIPAYGWIRRGKDKELKSNCGRKRVNINGVVNIDTLEVATDFTKSVNKESSLRLFRKIAERHPKAKSIHVILDNASYYKAKWLREMLQGTKIVLHFLPSYSPNLNLIERLWKFFKKEILYNRYYEKFEDFVEACKGFFRCRTKYREKLRSLLTENFHLYKAN